MTEVTEVNADAQAAAQPKATKAAVEVVQMEDGTQAEFVGKRKLLKESNFDAETPVVSLKFRNGKIVRFQIPADMLAMFAAHGAEQKLGDEAAGTELVDDMYVDIEALAVRLSDTSKSVEDRWYAAREPGSSIAGISDLVTALVEFSGKTVDQVKVFLADKDAKTKTALKNSDNLRPIVERLQKERAAKGPKIDTDSILAGLV